MTAPMVLDGAMNGTAFRAYVEQVLSSPDQYSPEMGSSAISVQLSESC